MNANPEQSEGACYTGAVNITAEARAHRAVLGRALMSGAPAALYGPKDLDPS